MKKKKYLVWAIVLIVSACSSIDNKHGVVLFDEAITKDKSVILLPNPQKKIGKPLMQAFDLRKSTREFSTQPISLFDLSNLLWAGLGMNREDGKRTTPTARNWQEIDIYFTTAYGAYFYNASDHSITQVVKEDIRALTTYQESVKDAPLNFIFVANYDNVLKDEPDLDRNKLYTIAATDVGFVSQNVYLYCASQNLATVVLGGFPTDTLAKRLGLRANQEIILTQGIGYFKE